MSGLNLDQQLAANDVDEILTPGRLGESLTNSSVAS